MRLKRWISYCFIFACVAICSALATISVQAAEYNSNWINTMHNQVYAIQGDQFLTWQDREYNGEQTKWNRMYVNMTDTVVVYCTTDHNVYFFSTSNTGKYRYFRTPVNDNPESFNFDITSSSNIVNNSFTKIINSTVIMDNSFQSLFPNYNDLYCWKYTQLQSDYNSIGVSHFDYEVSGSQDLYNKLEADNWNIPDPNVIPYNGLPFLSYSIKQSYVPTFHSNNNLLNPHINVVQSKEILSWNYTETEPYKSYPQGYTFDIKAWANFHTIDGYTGEFFDPDNLSVNPNNVVSITSGSSNISINEYSWLYDDIGSAIYLKSGKSFEAGSDTGSLALGYIVGVRTRTADASETSYWKLFKCQAGGYFLSTGKCIDDNGNVIDAPQNAPNSNDELTVQNNNDGKPVNYSTNSQTSAQSDPSGDVYDANGNFDSSSVIANLKSLVNSLKEIPQILTSVITFIPFQFVDLLILGLSLMVIVGIVRLIVG